MTIRSTEDLVAHLHALADAFGITLVQDARLRPEDAAAAVAVDRKSEVVTSRSQVVVAPVFEETGYAVALHEFGHILHPMGVVSGSPGLKLAAEEAAWEWAEHHALEWTPAMQQVREWALSTYRTPPRPAAPVGPKRNIVDVKTFGSKIKWHS